MITLLILILFVITLLIYGTKNFDYFQKKGIKYEKPIPIMGNFGKVFFLRTSWTQFLTDIYRKYPNEKVVGYYHFTNPELVIRDPEIVKRILITDFNYFYLRRFVPEGSSEPLLDNLFNADGDMWRLLRQRLSPAFTSGKLKAMFPLIVERAEGLYSRVQVADGAPVDARDLMARFATDFIGACGFGLEMDTLNEENSEFRKLGRKIVQVTFEDVLRGFLKILQPTIFKNVKFTGRLENDVLSFVRPILKRRKYEPSGRNDFVDLLLESKKKGIIKGESIERFKPDGTPEEATLELTDDLMAAQMFVFFGAGFETSSSTSSFTLHQLAYNPDKQKKVQKEIDRIYAKYNNKLCYDAVKEMRYLECAMKESMRMFPSVGFLMRECARNYDVPGMNLTIEKGIKVIIPIDGMQNDPEYFDNPEEFRPERFSPEELNVEQSKFTYLPFGEGPRACVGERLGVMQSMAGLAVVLSKFTVEPAPNSCRRPEADASPLIIQTISSGLPLIFRERQAAL